MAPGFRPIRSVYVSFVPDEEIGGRDGAQKFAQCDVFRDLNVGIVLDEGEFLLLPVVPTRTDPILKVMVTNRICNHNNSVLLLC